MDESSMDFMRRELNSACGEIKHLLRCIDDLKADIDELKIRVTVLENRTEPHLSERESGRRNADRIDGYDRDDIGESPDQ